jgi:hypothetical protein
LRFAGPPNPKFGGPVRSCCLLRFQQAFDLGYANSQFGQLEINLFTEALDCHSVVDDQLQPIASILSPVTGAQRYWIMLELTRHSPNSYPLQLSLN